tara:strand:+ start:1244 stop:2104 length:861 start_codon:yes stop_codon:yes gene_type:complete
MCKKTVVLTGASGFLGQHFVQELSSEYKIISVSQKKIKQENVENIQINFSEREAFFDLILQRKPSYIFNFRACFENNTETSFKVNVDFPRKLLNFLSRQKLSSRVVLIGSAAEYGFNRLKQPLKEEHPLLPTSVYGSTKAMQSLLPSLYKQEEVDVVYARLFNLYGSNVNENLLPGLLSKKIHGILSGKSEKIKLRPLIDIYDFIHVSDAIKMLKLVSEKGKTGEIYNVASGIPLLVRDFVKKQLKKHNLDFESVVEEASEKSSDVGKIIYGCTKKINSLNERSYL